MPRAPMLNTIFLQLHLMKFFRVKNRNFRIFDPNNLAELVLLEPSWLRPIMDRSFGTLFPLLVELDVVSRKSAANSGLPESVDQKSLCCRKLRQMKRDVGLETLGQELAGPRSHRKKRKISI